MEEDRINAASLQGRGKIPSPVCITPAPGGRGFPDQIETSHKKCSGIREQTGCKTQNILRPHGITPGAKAVPQHPGTQPYTAQVFSVEFFIKILKVVGSVAKVHIKDSAPIALAGIPGNFRHFNTSKPALTLSTNLPICQLLFLKIVQKR